MTLIAAWAEKNIVHMASDSHMTNGYQGTTYKLKVRVHGEGKLLIGYAGYLRAVQVIERNWKPDLAEFSGSDEHIIETLGHATDAWVRFCKERDCPIIGSENRVEALIAVDGRIFSVTQHQVVTRHNAFHAIGSGEDVALGVLHTLSRFAPNMLPRARLESAMDISAKLIDSVRAPFNFYTTDSPIKGEGR